MQQGNTLPRVKILCGCNPVTSIISGLKKKKKHGNTTNIMTFRRLLWAGGICCEFRLQNEYYKGGDF